MSGRFFSLFMRSSLLLLLTLLILPLGLSSCHSPGSSEQALGTPHDHPVASPDHEHTDELSDTSTSDDASSSLSTDQTFLEQAHTLPNAGFFSNEIGVELQEEFLIVRSSGLPPHTTGSFPNPGNPHTISAQDYEFSLTLSPTPLSEPSSTAAPGFYGVALNGVTLEPGTGEYWNDDRSSGWNMDILAPGISLGLDQNGAHVQPSGAYHYHTFSQTLSSQSRPLADDTFLIGYAADGYPILYDEDQTASWRLRSGTRPSDAPPGPYDGTYVQDYEFLSDSGTLDECNGRTSETRGYAYYMTEAFPYLGRCHRATPDQSFSHSPSGPPPRR